MIKVMKVTEKNQVDFQSVLGIVKLPITIDRQRKLGVCHRSCTDGFVKTQHGDEDDRHGIVCPPWLSSFDCGKSDHDGCVVENGLIELGSFSGNCFGNYLESDRIQNTVLFAKTVQPEWKVKVAEQVRHGRGQACLPMVFRDKPILSVGNN